MGRSYQGVMHGDLKLFTGTANPALAQEICQYLGIPVGGATVSAFSDGEIRVRLDENVRGRTRSWSSRVVNRSIRRSWNC